MNIFKKEPNFKLMNKKYYAFIISGLVIIAGLVTFQFMDLNLGIDFSGGTMIEVSFKDNISINYLRDSLDKVGIANSEIVRVKRENKFFIKTMMEITETGETEEFDEHERKASLIREVFRTPEETENLKAGKIDLNNSTGIKITDFLTSRGISLDDAADSGKKIVDLRKNFEDKSGNLTGLISDFNEIEKLDLKKRVLSKLKENAFLGSLTFLSTEFVGPQVGHQLRGQAARATFFALIGMLIYIGFRFRPIYGIAAVITLFHDVVIVFSFILFLNIEVSLQVVAAILTIVGYSLNDTIVIFDRVRDNVKLMRKEGAEMILDRSINQTLSRTIVTSTTTLATVLALFFLGGEVIHNFSLTLIIGIIVGTYSSIFQSCAWLKIWEKKFLSRKKYK
ncbi:MAG: protein translocase subunit SecF [Candidatus Aminicenantes bacterium]|nr:protein translocase subunit SecF [Candidatus Aminicenantes bacterium]